MFIRLYHWIESKLNRKYILGMASGLVAISVLFAALFIGMSQKILSDERANTSLQLNKLLQTALEHAMKRRDLEGIREIILQFGEQDEIRNVMILNTEGEIRLATQQQLIGSIDKKISSAKTAYTLFKDTPDTGEVLRSVNPIYNQDDCEGCHNKKESHPINGVLVVDFDASILRKNARESTLALMGAGSTVVLITLFGGWWFMGFFVLKPVHRLLKAQQEFTNGNLKTRVETYGDDEISKLGKSFNSMAKTIEKQWNTLESRRKFLQSLIDGIPDGVRVLDQENNILLTNQAYAEQFGTTKEEILKTKCFATHQRKEPCIPTLETCPLYEIKNNGKPVKVVHHHTNSTGEEQSVEIFAAPVEGGESWGKAPIIIEVIRDLSNSINYSQEQRLTALGMLASGVAHEIHNPLGSIQIAFQSIDQLIESKEPVIDQLKYYIELIEGEIDKCVDITGRLLKLGNLPDTHLQPIEINNVVSETLSLLEWEASSRNIKMKMELPKKSLRVMATDTELRMMILNLVQNAYHAMPDGGELKVSVILINHEVITSIEDTGVGIEENIQSRIFDPFFSHRSDNEKGTGLGLSITKAIVKRFNGQIQVSSKLGEGSVFTVVLPNADNDFSNTSSTDTTSGQIMDKDLDKSTDKNIDPNINKTSV